ncbi:MAG: response regulator transcription factor [Lachnospiraceae bacterium]|nr:response regulator transcription factor [Lachnospiraceae bacterium]
MKAKILVIEDETAINDLLCMNLEVAGYEVQSFFDGAQAESALEKVHDYACAIVDIMLPGRDGFELLPLLSRFEIPVIFLTARVDLSSKIKGLRDGAEDYITKPFEMLELLVRLEKVLERHPSRQETITIKNVRINPNSRTVLKDGQEISLTPMEYDCLMMLVRHKNMALTRDQLLTALWGFDFEGETRTVDAHVGRIRKKLDFGDVIKTIPRIGYRLEVDE